MNKFNFIWIVTLFLLISSAGILLIGEVFMPINQLLACLTNKNAECDILLRIRLPALITAAVCGANLAVCGMTLQEYFRNPLCSPYILGISAGSSILVAVALFIVPITFLSGRVLMIVASGAGAFLITFLIIMLSLRMRKSSSLLISGLMIGFILNAFLTIAIQYADPASLREFMYWNFGSFLNTDLYESLLFAGMSIIGISMFYLIANGMNILQLGEEEAKSFGVKIISHRWKVMVLVSILVGISTSFCGPVAFLGLAVPHITNRLVYLSGYKEKVFFNALMGAFVATVALYFHKGIGFITPLPLNAITAFIGAPLIVLYLTKNQSDA